MIGLRFGAWADAAAATGDTTGAATAFAAAAPPDKVSLYLVNHLTHVEVGPARLLDGFELWQAVYRILAERDSLPAPDPERCLPK